MIRKFAFVLMLVAALTMVGGCCTRLDSSTGKTTTSFLNCLTSAQSFVCSPPADVQAVASAAVPLLVATLNVLVPASAAYINVANAATTAQALQQGLCVFTTDLNNLIAQLQSPQVMAVQAKMMAAKAPVVPVNVQVLINWEILNGQTPK